MKTAFKRAGRKQALPEKHLSIDLMHRAGVLLHVLWLSTRESLFGVETL